ncbi:hypothetical protein T458_08655 [Brevibacillus panacihumi W25]|uniref:Helix-turn-helix conjugative transposon-like domain-containing protein n=1 Tax=Brevibacillus panacihumi W25 TaxID=1408254 RepID=V6MA69_9BACL|nr:helix-turn-helix domain-containing protein [Brevibacillus panacihumi]EST55147.1 hypothetical protein T458_08655 [Brevibacillus panacihumi W25]
MSRTHTQPKKYPFGKLLKLAEMGDQHAMEQILKIFESDMEQLASFIRMPREESLQQIKVDFIEEIMSGKV